MSDHIYVSKLDSAKRQLEMAIRLFLSYEDIISVHTLTAAAHQILKDLSNKQGKESAIKDGLMKRVKPEKRKEFWNMINDPENFFKHADRDPEGLLKFYTGNTEMLLWDVCLMYQNLVDELPPLVRIYYLWYYSSYPGQLADTSETEAYKKGLTDLNLDCGNRTKFLEYFKYAQKVGPM